MTAAYIIGGFVLVCWTWLAYEIHRAPLLDPRDDEERAREELYG